MAQVVQTFEGHPAGERPVPHHRRHPPGVAGGGKGGSQAVGVGEGGGGVAVFDPVMRGFHPAGITGHSAGAAKGGEGPSPAGEQLVGIGLMAGVEQNHIPGGVVHPVQGDGQFHYSQVGPQMAAVGADGGYDHRPDFPGQAYHLLRVQPAQMAGFAYAVQQGGGGRGLAGLGNFGFQIVGRG